MKTALITGLLLCLAIAIAFALLRAIRGPRMADRIMGINMLGGLTVAALAALAILLDESWLLDVSIIYALLSFLAVVVLAKVNIASTGKKEKTEEEQNGK